jgi:hypothetical protein
MYYSIMRWFDSNWYEYLFESSFSIKKLWCRLRGHPCGCVYYSSGLEPDYHCKNCGDEL